MAGFRIEGNTSGNVGEVDSQGQQKVALSTSSVYAGFAALASRMDAGSVTGTTSVLELQGTFNRAQKVSQMIPLWSDDFNVTSGINGMNYQARTSTMTVTTAAGVFRLNAGGITTASTSACLQTYRHFPFRGDSTIRMEITGYQTVAPQANEQLEIGLITCSTVGATAATDGVFFRYNAAAELRGVVSYGGTETQTAAITPPSINVMHEYKIDINDEQAWFWIDDVLRAKINLQTDAPTQPGPTRALASPMTVRYFIASTAPSLGNQFVLGDVNIVAYDQGVNKPWTDTLAGMGQHAYQGQNGAAAYGTIAQYANSATPAAATPTNTAANLGSGLGGIFNSSTNMAASTDCIISSFQNPLGSVNQQPRTLYIQGVNIDTQTVITATNAAMVLGWSLAFGHNAVSLATSTNAGTGLTGANRIALGAQSITSTSPNGFIAQNINRQFRTPIPVMPGQFIQAVVRQNGPVATPGQLLYYVTFDGYFE
jgi:hypothetical protein